jgi:hypothetical protein
MNIPNDFLVIWLIILTCMVLARGNGITQEEQRWLNEQREKEKHWERETS